MAPPPSRTSTARRATSSNSASALPGMKRGIAIGVAASLCVLLIALLAYFAVRRRRRIKASQQQQQQQQHLDASKTLTADSRPEYGWPNEKFHTRKSSQWTVEPPLPPPPPPPPPPKPVEADARTIYELDAGVLPELPGRTYTPVSSRPGTGNSSTKTATNHADMMDNDRPYASFNYMAEVERERCRGRALPVLQISPPEASPLELVDARLSVDGAGSVGGSAGGSAGGKGRGSPLSISSLSVSPLEEGFLVGRRGEGGWV